MIFVEYDCGFENGKNMFHYRAGAIIVEDGCVLLAENGRENFFYSVGGGVHMNETAQEAVVRECLEETGVNYDVDRLAVIHENFWKGNGAYDKGFDCHEISFYFIMKPRNSRELNSNSYARFGDKESLHWIPIKDLDKYKCFPSFLKDYLNAEHSGIEHIVTDGRAERFDENFERVGD